MPPDGSPDGMVQPDWIWDEKRMRELLAFDDAEALFVGGCVENQGAFYPSFDEIVLLTASPEMIIQRLTTRTTNPFGKDPRQLSKVLSDRRKFEPQLRRGATVVIDTTAPVEECVQTILDLVEA